MLSVTDTSTPPEISTPPEVSTPRKGWHHRSLLADILLPCCTHCLPSCQDCQGMQSCLQVCKQACTTARAINPADCLSYGRQAASSVSQKACTMAMVSAGVSCTVPQLNVSSRHPIHCWEAVRAACLALCCDQCCTKSVPGSIAQSLLGNKNLLMAEAQLVSSSA